MKESYHLADDDGAPLVVANLSCRRFEDPSGKLWRLDHIKVNPAQPLGEGWGTTLLREICQIADDEGVTIEAGVEPDDPDEFDRLAAWYVGFGFTREAEGPLTPRHNKLIRRPRICG